ncbi:UNVERIFIED_CONTAM: hypothetical protein Cloal_2336 [Acetivibrio alkalicellulosi]
MPKRDTVLTAVYVEDTQMVEYEPFIALSEDVLIDKNDKTMMVTANRSKLMQFSLIKRGVHFDCMSLFIFFKYKEVNCL